jgi:hypothetical protein
MGTRVGRGSSGPRPRRGVARGRWDRVLRVKGRGLRAVGVLRRPPVSAVLVAGRVRLLVRVAPVRMLRLPLVRVRLVRGLPQGLALPVRVLLPALVLPVPVRRGQPGAQGHRQPASRQARPPVGRRCRLLRRRPRPQRQGPSPPAWPRPRPRSGTRPVPHRVNRTPPRPRRGTRALPRPCRGRGTAARWDRVRLCRVPAHPARVVPPAGMHRPGDGADAATVPRPPSRPTRPAATPDLAAPNPGNAPAIPARETRPPSNPRAPSNPTPAAGSPPRAPGRPVPAQVRVRPPRHQPWMIARASGQLRTPSRGAPALPRVPERPTLPLRGRRPRVGQHPHLEAKVPSGRLFSAASPTASEAINLR